MPRRSLRLGGFGAAMSPIFIKSSLGLKREEYWDKYCVDGEDDEAEWDADFDEVEEFVFAGFQDECVDGGRNGGHECGGSADGYSHCISVIVSKRNEWNGQGHRV